MIFIIIILITSLMLIFSNILFYTMSLLFISVSLLFILVYINYISVLIILLVVIVYVGAIIIFIGYICAICPNFNTSPSYNFISVSLLFIPIYFCFDLPFITNTAKQTTILDCFFSFWGTPIFVLIAFMLFFVLLIVTSQYSSPQAPFRSI